MWQIQSYSRALFDQNNIMNMDLTSRPGGRPAARGNSKRRNSKGAAAPQGGSSAMVYLQSQTAALGKMTTMKTVQMTSMPTKTITSSDKKDNVFLVHKRGAKDMASAAQAKLRSNSKEQSEMLGKTGRNQPRALDTETSEANTMSDMQSNQNFSYYNRRINDGSNSLREASPVASDAVSMSITPGKTTSFANQTRGKGTNKKMWTEEKTTKDRFATEAQLKDNLMKELEPMFAGDENIKAKPKQPQDVSVQLKTMSDIFPNSKAQMAKTTTAGFGRGNGTTNNGGGSQTRTGTASTSSRPQVQQGLRMKQMPTKTLSSAAKVLPPKLPPKPAMSPAVSQMKSDASKILQTVETPNKEGAENFYFAHQSQASTAQTPKTDLVKDFDNSKYGNDLAYKRGARSISRGNIDMNVNKQLARNLLNKKAENQGSNEIISLVRKSERDNSEGSLEQRMHKFNKNFTSTGHCRQHKKIGCELCSFGSSKGSRVSSLSSGGHNALISRDVLKNNKMPPRSEIGQKINRSVTRKMNQKPNAMIVTRNSISNVKDVLSSLDNRVRSLPRGESSTLVGQNSQIIGRMNNVRRSDVQEFKPHLQGMRSQQPSMGQLQRTDRSPGNLMSEIPRRQQHGQRGSAVTSIPNFHRANSAMTNNVHRRDLSRRLIENQVKNEQSNFLQSDVKQLADEWEGDPHDPEFWKRIEQQNDQLKEQKRSLVQGQNVRTQMHDHLERQSSAFKQLREDDMNSDRGSMRGTAMNFNKARESLNQDLVRNRAFQTQSNASIAHQTPTQQPYDDDEPEPCQTEFAVQDSAPTTGKRMNHGHAVLTDNDISDEVFPSAQRNYQMDHQLQFRDRNAPDGVTEDKNIDSMKKQLERQINRSKDRSSARRNNASNVGTSHNISTGCKPQSSLAEPFLTSEQKRPEPPADDDEPQKPSCFEDQNIAHSDEDRKNFDVDGDDEGDQFSEEAIDFDEQKQKSEILGELGMDCFDENEEEYGIEDEFDDKEQKKEKRRSNRKKKNTMTTELGSEKMSEKSGEDEDEKRQNEIHKKTLAQVKDYDEYLEARTQKEVERLSQIDRESRMGNPFSPKSNIKIPASGIMKLANDPREFNKPATRDGSMNRRANKTQHNFGRNAENVMDHNHGDHMRGKTVTEEDNAFANARNSQLSRPKTRGELGSAGGIDQLSQTPKGELSEKKERINNSFNTKRTADQTDPTAQQSYMVSTQKMPMREIVTEMRSPEKRFLVAGTPGGQGQIPSELNLLSNAPTSLKDDDLMISSSQVDPIEARSMRGGKSKLTQITPRNDIIKEEENSSLQSVSQLTDPSQSRKSSRISMSPAQRFRAPATQDPNELPAIVNVSQQQQQTQLPKLQKKGLPPKLPPKSPLLSTTSKLKQHSILSPQRIAALPELQERKSSLPGENRTSFVAPPIETPSNNRQVSFADTPLSPTTSSKQPVKMPRVSSAERRNRNRGQGSRSRNDALEQIGITQEQPNQPGPFSPKRHQVVAPMLTEVNQPPRAEPTPAAVGQQRNQAVLDFLAFEDSDDDELGQIMMKNDIVQAPISQTAPPEPFTMMQNRPEDDQVLQMSPRVHTLAKNQSAQFEANETFLQSNPAAMRALKQCSFMEMQPQVTMTPTAMLTNKKAKALQLKKAQITQAQMPRHSTSIEDNSVNEQINRIDYNQSNDGMSASYYRDHDQWMALQALLSEKQQKIDSQRPASRISVTSGSNRHQQQAANDAGPMNPSKIADQAKEAEKQVVERRKSAQSRTGEPRPSSQNRTESRQSGSYSRPQSYVNKMVRKQDSRQSFNETQSSLDGMKKDPKQMTAEKFMPKDGAPTLERVKQDPKLQTAQNFMPKGPSRDGAGSRNAMRQSTSIDSRGAPSSRRKDFFEKHKGSIADSVQKTAQKKKETSNDSRAAAQNRLFGQETIASILKKNPELAYDMKNLKNAKPPTQPKRAFLKKKVQEPPKPEPPKEDPPEEPLPQSPRVLLMVEEAAVPHQDSAPTNMPLKMRLPEEPPSEPSAFVMANLYCPADPDTPYCFEIEPRDEENHLAPLEPSMLHKPLDPESPLQPESIVKVTTADFNSEQVQECEYIERKSEPIHDDEPMLEYPVQERILMPPSDLPSKFEPPGIVLVAEPLLVDEGVMEYIPTLNDPMVHYLHPDNLEKTHEMNIQCDFEEQKEEVKQQYSNRHSLPLDVIDEEPSDEDNFSAHSCEGTNNKVTVGIQTNEAHFRNVERTAEFKRKRQERIESTDWALSPMFDEIHFAKQKKSIGGRKLMNAMSSQTERFENCGNQVEQSQIVQETAVQILSHIECEYNVDQLKRKMAGKDAIEGERLHELYAFGLNTLKALMLGLRLEKEWQLQIRHQYPMPEQGQHADPDELVRLLIRNKKMYDAKTLIQRLLKMIVDRDAMVEEAQELRIISTEMVAQVKRLSIRITSQINTLQEEHRIFRRPFILKGVEYLDQIQREGSLLDDLLAQKFFVDERGTVGTNPTSTINAIFQRP